MHNRTRRVAALAILAAGAATIAHAQSIGYMATFEGGFSPEQSYNSAGGTNSYSVIGTGAYLVTLPGLGNGLNSNVQVNAVNTNGQGHYCTSNGWFTFNGVDVGAEVACFDALGNPLAADFSLFYQARTTPPPSGAIAFLWADQPGIAIGSSYTPLASWNYNSTGQTNSVSHEATGSYSVFLPGLKVGGNPQVTAYGASAARCEVSGWTQNAFGIELGVYCVNAGGTAADAYFNLSYAQGALQSAGPAATSLGGYVWANNATRKNYVPAKNRQFNTVPTGPVTAQRIGGLVAGLYSFTLPNSDSITFSTALGMVTAVGTSGEYCDTGAGPSIPPGPLSQNLVCYGANGLQADAQYTSTLMFSQ